MKTPHFFKPGCLVKIITGIRAGQIGTIHAIALTREFDPLISVKFLDTETGRFLSCVYIRGDLELLPSCAEAILAYTRMNTPEPLRAVARCA